MPSPRKHGLALLLLLSGCAGMRVGREALHSPQPIHLCHEMPLIPNGKSAIVNEAHPIGQDQLGVRVFTEGCRAQRIAACWSGGLLTSEPLQLEFFVTESTEKEACINQTSEDNQYFSLDLVNQRLDASRVGRIQECRVEKSSYRILCSL